jgi:uncharacterized membrane protein YkvA (DUF1232 family)
VEGISETPPSGKAGEIATRERFCRTVSMDGPGDVEAAGAATLDADLCPLPSVPPPRTPWYAKVFVALIVGYVFSPLDPIPDFIPGVGLLDEMVVPVGVLIAAKMIPRPVMEECQAKAREVAEGEKPMSRVAAVVVVAVWLLCVALAVVLALRVF